MAEIILPYGPEYQACRLSAKIQVDEPPVSPTRSYSLKRKAGDGADEDDDDERNSKKQRILHHHDASSSGPYRLASILPSEPLSINGILRQHCRKRLYVTPLHWKLQHLELLGCRFRVKIEKKEKTNPTESDGHVQKTHSPPGQPQEQAAKNTTKLPPSFIIREAASDLLDSSYSRYTLASVKSNAMRRLLRECGMTSDACSPTVHFRFNKRPVAALHTDGIFIRTSSLIDSPSLAFLNLRIVGMRRDHSIKPRRFNETNPPGYSIRRKKLENIRPANEAEDPYIAAVLIALAQEQRIVYNEAVTTKEDTPDMPPKDYEAFVLALSSLGTPCLYFYTAQISSSFLDRLDNPSLNIQSRPFRIKYHRIPLSPTKAMKRVLKFAISVIHGGNYVF